MSQPKDKPPRTSKAEPACGNCVYAGPPVVCPGSVVRVKCASTRQRNSQFGDDQTWKDTNGWCPLHLFKSGDST